MEGKNVSDLSKLVGIEPSEKISDSEDFETATKAILTEPNKGIANLMLGKETEIDKKQDVHTHTYQKTGKTLNWDLSVYENSKGQKRYVLYERKYPEQIDAAALVDKDGKVLQITTSKDFRKIGLAQTLLKEVKSDIGKIIPSEPISKAGKKALDNFAKSQISEAYHKAKADGSNPELVKAVEELLGKEEVKVEMKAQEPTEIKTDDLEAKKADIEKRRQEEIEKIVANIFPNTKVKQILFRAAKKGLDKFSPSNETRGIYASGSKSEVDQYLARDRKNSKIYTIVMDIRNPKEYRKRYSFTDTRHTNLDEAIKEGKDGIIVTGRDGEINEEVAVVNSNQIHILSEKEISNIDTINAKYDAELSELENKKRHKSEVTADMKAQEPTEITTDDLEAKKADIPLGKVGNTEYEVKSDGVYYQDKKLDNPENKTHRQLIEADIERRRKEALPNGNKQIDVTDNHNLLDEYLSKEYSMYFEPTKSEGSETDTEAKKAYIEKRRQEALDSLFSKTRASVDKKLNTPVEKISKEEIAKRIEEAKEKNKDLIAELENPDFLNSKEREIS